MTRRIVPASLLVTLALASGVASAQDGPTEVARRELIAQAEAAATAGDHARAAQLGERAAQLRVTPTIQYFLAREHLALEHPVEALGYSGACARAAEADTTLRNRDGVLAACRAIVTTTEAQVGRVTVHVPSDAPAGLTVRLRGAAFPSTLFDVAYPVAPGTVVLEASAPGHLPLRREATVAAGHTETLDVRLEAEPTVVAPTPPVAPAVVAVVVPPRVAAPMPRSYSIGPWMVVGGGAAAFILSGVFYGLASSELSARDGLCPAPCVDPGPEARAHDASYGEHIERTNVALGVGAALVVGGGVWLLVDRLSHRASTETTVRAVVTPNSIGLAGRF